MSADVERLSAALVGRYVIHELVGEGGMATVYRATDVRHDRPVALKVLRPELAAVLGPERFLQEIKVTARLQHPHILPLHDSGEAEGLLFYVMPFVEGETLRDRLVRDGALPLAEAAAIAADVASALDYAHQHGVVHRDIKPENILLHDDQAVVADFGIALAVSRGGGTRLTGTGLSLGTPGYMSPEQAMGEADLDARTDVYALGCMVYEMLAGDPPFTGSGVQAVLARVIGERPPPIGAVRGHVPARVEHALQKALAKPREDRFATAGAFAREIGEAPASAAVVSGWRRRAVIAVGAGVGVVMLATAVLRYRAAANRRWAREVALPQIERLVLADQYVPAFQLWQDAADDLGEEDAYVAGIRDEVVARLSGTSNPPGATVAYQAYDAGDSTWYPIGLTPLDSAEVPGWVFRLRFEREGYQPLELTQLPLERVQVTLVPDSGLLSDMVWVPQGVHAYTSEDPVPVPGFFLDTREVPNRNYQAFVDAGGYRDSVYWAEPVRDAGSGLTWGDLVSRFTDATGRPGPAGWELSHYPEGDDDLPVRGVSWFEAAAFCAWAGKTLPTYFHWKRAAGLDVVDDMLKVSNFNAKDVRPVGARRAVGAYGAMDMAGNVAEWVWNASVNRRYILGGSYGDPEYRFLDADAADPFTRRPATGFRCASYPDPVEAALKAPVPLPVFDFSTVQPVSDEEFAIFKRFYDYEATDLDAVVEHADTLQHWIRQRVSFAAAYPDERVVAYLFLPRNSPPPYQSVIFFPGIDAFIRRTSEPLAGEVLLSFIPRSGRVLVYPVYKGTHERFIEHRQPGKAASRQRTVWMTQDLRRTVDYLETRDDLRHDAIGYIGVSYGAEIGVPYALEPRIKALVLVGSAFDAQWLAGVLPEYAPWNFVGRATQPALMINGRNDFQHPFETGQIPFFNALGAPRADKDTVILETGHIPPWNEVVKHALDWFDRYLGPVEIPRD